MFLTHTVILFVALTLVFQCLSLYSLVTMGRRIYVLESRSDSNNSANYLKQLVNLSLRGIAGGPESVNASKVLMTWRTDHSHTSDEVLDYDQTKDKCMSYRINFLVVNTFLTKSYGERSAGNVVRNVVGFGCCGPRLN